MAKGKKTGGKDWQPGESGNPKGSIGLPGDVRAAKKLTAAELQRSLTSMLQMTPTALMERIKQPDVTNIEVIVGSIIEQATKHGCPQRLNFLFDRIVGKVKDKLEVEIPTPFIIKRSDGSTVEMGTQTKEIEE